MTHTPTTRASLLFRLRDSEDRDAWLEFVALYEPVVYRLLRRNGLQDADAREVMQELLIAVHRNINRWEPSKERGSFRGWLRRVTRNLTVSWLRQRDRHVLASGGTDLQSLLEQLPAHSDAESAEFDQELRRAQFRQMAEQVRAEVRPAAWEAFWETGVVGTSVAEAAQKLGMTAGAVRVAKCRLLHRLRAAFAELEERR